MHIRCPHCHQQIELIQDDLAAEVVCSQCGSSFSLISGDTETRDHAKRRTLGQFELLERVGIGKFGEVWKARDTQLDRIVAVKVPRKGQLERSEAEAFLREARAAAQLSHPNIVAVHEAGRDGESLYIVSDFVQGANLHEWLTARRLTPREAAELCAKIADALAHAHAAGVVHRDLKPGNIMLDAAGDPHITDFGLAKREAGEITMTLDGAILGTPAYMSPEQARGEAHRADARSDVYSMGVILFELLTGELPFRGDTRMLLVQILNDEPPSPRKLNARVPRDMETICLKCLEKDPKRRYAAAGELADELRRFLDQKPIQARAVGPVARGWRWCKRYPTIAALSAAVLVTLLSGSAISTHFAVRASRNAEAMTGTLYQSYMQQVQARRAERAQGYRQLVRQLIDSARKLDTPAVNLAELRQEMVLAMGDFVGSPPVTIDGFPSDATALALSPDGSQLAIGFRNGSVWICETASETRRVQLPSGQASVLMLRFTADGHRLVAADAKGLVRQWIRGNGDWSAEKSFHVEVEMSAARYGASQHDDSLVAFETGSIEVWEIDKRRRWRSFPVAGWTPQCAALDANRTRLAVAYTQGTSEVIELAVWNLENDQVVHEKFGLGWIYPNGMAFSGDSRRLAIGFDEGQVVYDTSDFRQVTLKRSDAVKAVTFSPNNQYLAAVDIRGRITLLNTATNGEVATLFNWRKTGSSECLVFSRDGSSLAESNAASARIWSLVSAREKLVLLGHAGGVPCIAFSGDGELMASGSKDRQVRLWEPRSGQLVANIPAPGAVQAVAFSPDQRFLAVGYWESKDQGIQIFDVKTRKALVTMRHELGEVVDSLAMFDREGEHFLAASGDSGLSLWRLRMGEAAPTPITLERVAHQDGQLSLNLAVSFDSHWITWVDNRNTIRLWNVVESRPCELHAPKMNQGWHGLAFDRADNNLVFISDKGMAEFWDVAHDSPAFRLGDIGHFKAPQIALSPDGKWLAGLVEPDFVEVWDTTQRKLAYSLRPERSSIWSLAWSPDNQRLAVGSVDGGLAIWNISVINEELKQMGLSEPSEKSQ
jgi:serine/threonine protein kinase/WD40 repeat protein